MENGYRVDKVGGTERASSCSDGMESKFYSKCYVTPLKDFKQKEKKKTCHSLGVPNAWHIAGAWKLDE